MAARKLRKQGGRSRTSVRVVFVPHSLCLCLSHMLLFVVAYPLIIRGERRNKFKTVLELATVATFVLPTLVLNKQRQNRLNLQKQRLG